MLMLPHYEIKKVWLDQSDISEGCVEFSELISTAKDQLGFTELIGMVAVLGEDGNTYILDVTMVPLEEAEPEVADYVEMLMESEDELS